MSMSAGPPTVLRPRSGTADVATLYRLHFDYGKFDYVVHEGRAVLIDTNKTTGSPPSTNPEREARRRILADGLYPYFD